MPVLDFKKVLNEYEANLKSRAEKAMRTKAMHEMEEKKDNALLRDFALKLGRVDTVSDEIMDIIKPFFTIRDLLHDTKHYAVSFKVTEIQNSRRTIEVCIKGIVDHDLQKRVVHIDRTLIKAGNIKEQMRSLEIPIDQYKDEYLEKVIYDILQSFSKY
jgi:hypothetical protein